MHECMTLTQAHTRSHIQTHTHTHTAPQQIACRLWGWGEGAFYQQRMSYGDSILIAVPAPSTIQFHSIIRVDHTLS